MRSAEQFDAAKRLIAAGVSDCAIARQIGVSRATVRDWRCRPQVRPRLVSTVMPGQHAAIMEQAKGCVEVALYSKHWPYLLPQHGPGKKHTRPIRLEAWQQVLVNEATEEFVRGLIDSDGRYVIAVYRKSATARLDEFVGPKS